MNKKLFLSMLLSIPCILFTTAHAKNEDTSIDESYLQEQEEQLIIKRQIALEQLELSQRINGFNQKMNKQIQGIVRYLKKNKSSKAKKLFYWLIDAAVFVISSVFVVGIIWWRADAKKVAKKMKKWFPVYSQKIGDQEEQHNTEENRHRGSIKLDSFSNNNNNNNWNNNNNNNLKLRHRNNNNNDNWNNNNNNWNNNNNNFPHRNNNNNNNFQHGNSQSMIDYDNLSNFKKNNLKEIDYVLYSGNTKVTGDEYHIKVNDQPYILDQFNCYRAVDFNIGDDNKLNFRFRGGRSFLTSYEGNQGEEEVEVKIQNKCFQFKRNFENDLFYKVDDEEEKDDVVKSTNGGSVLFERTILDDEKSNKIRSSDDDSD